MFKEIAEEYKQKNNYYIERIKEKRKKLSEIRRFIEKNSNDTPSFIEIHLCELEEEFEDKIDHLEYNEQISRKMFEVFVLGKGTLITANTSTFGKVYGEILSINAHYLSVICGENNSIVHIKLNAIEDIEALDLKMKG